MTRRQERLALTPPGSENRVGVGNTGFRSHRCRATHDVPYSLRCIKYEHTEEMMHEDKEGNQW